MTLGLRSATPDKNTEQGHRMDTKVVEFKNVYFENDEEECVWKVVIKNNLKGEGTSFDPKRLTRRACRCVTCDGHACDCLSYSA